MTMGRVWVDAAVTDVLVHEAHVFIDGQVNTYGLGVVITDLKVRVLRHLMLHPQWNNTGTNTWDDYPSHCTDSTDAGRTHGLWACIVGRYALHSPGHGITYRLDRSGNATNDWLVTDDMGEMLQKFSMTMANNFARHRNDSRSVMNMARSRSDGLYLAFTDGYAGALRVGDAIINGCLRVSDDINDLPAPQLHARYPWRTATGVTDALRTLQNICGTNIPELTPIATAFWNDYRGKLLAAGITP